MIETTNLLVYVGGGLFMALISCTNLTAINIFHDRYKLTFTEIKKFSLTVNAQSALPFSTIVILKNALFIHFSISIYIFQIKFGRCISLESRLKGLKSFKYRNQVDDS